MGRVGWGGGCVAVESFWGSGLKNWHQKKTYPGDIFWSVPMFISKKDTENKSFNNYALVFFRDVNKLDPKNIAQNNQLVSKSFCTNISILFIL